MTGSAHAVTGSEQTVYGGHTVVAPLVLMSAGVIGDIGYPVLIRTGTPDTAAAGVRTEHIRLCRHNLRTNLLGLNVHTGPETSLTNGHIQEVFPGLRLEVLPEFLQGFFVHTSGFTILKEGI